MAETPDAPDALATVGTVDAPAADDFWRDPFPTYRDLYRNGPLHWNDELAAWIVTGHEEARAALTDPALSSQWLAGPLFHGLHGRAVEHVRDWLIWQDPPRHQAVRARLAPAFTSRSVAARSLRIRELVQREYAGFRHSGGGDALSQLAMPLVVRLMAESVGIEHVERDLLSDWSAAAGSLMAKPLHRPTARAADAALERLAGSLPAHPAADTVLERADGALPGCDPLHLASLFAFAGIETTGQAATRLIDLYARGLVDPRAPAPDAVAASLRFDTAVPQVPRVAAEPTELCGQRVEAGDSVVVILAAANRDPRMFAEPQAAPATAGASRHLAYGYGRHRCLGAPLADAVLVELLRELRRHPAPRLPRPAEWYHDRGYRGIASLEVAFES